TSAHTLDWTLSYNFRHEGWVHGPTAGIRYTNGSIDPYSEGSTAPAAGLMSVSGQDFSVFRVNAGYNVAFHIPIDAGKVVPYFGAVWIHEKREFDAATASFQGTPFFGIGGGGLIPTGNGPSAAIGGGNSTTSYVNLRAGVELLTHKGLSLNVQGYVNVFRNDMVDAGAGLQVGYAF
ncbi:MAG: autotransporter domain-containing protein, partial [Verrucomicrobiaceae bacterium]|nr:autotransporter domain-containing protein [Verrucomicrobiaceae bacterium]